MKFLKNKYKRIGNRLVKELKGELEAQGHVATGRLKNSIRWEVSKNGKNLRIRALPRWKDVNDGQPKGTKVGDLKLKRWMSAKGIDWRSDKSLIFLIGRAIEQEGTPTRIVKPPKKLSAFGYTKNGRRTGFIDIVLKRNKISITKEVRNGITLDWRSTIRKVTDLVVATSKSLKRK